MANELAAMATMPSGATTTVVAICAPQMAMCSNPIGNEIRKDLRNVSRLGRKLPRSPTNFSMGERRHRYHIIPPAVTSSANTVPNIAPFTPRPAPGAVNTTPNHSTCLVGKIRKKLNTTSSKHIIIFSMAGTRIFPLQRNMPPARKFNCKAGRNSANILK